MQSLGDQIRVIREQLRMTQVQLAQRSGLSQSFIAETESGKRFNLSMVTINKLARGLNCQFVGQLVLTGDISKMLDEQSENVARKIVSITSGSTAIELQLPSQSLVNEQIEKLKKDILEKHLSALWQKI